MSSAPPYPRPIVAWTMVASLFVAYIFSFIDRMLIGLLVEPIKADLGLTDTQISLLQGLAFAIFYTAAGIPIGRWIDRTVRTRAVAVGIAVWSGMTILCGTAGNFWQFFLARTGVGVGEAVLSPAAYSIISDSFPRQRLGLAMGVYGLGSAVGAGLAFIIGALVISLVAQAGTIVVPGLGAVAAWQVAFFVAGFPGFLVALVFLFLQEPLRRERRSGESASLPWAEVGAHVSQARGFYLGTLLAIGFVNLAVLGSISWLPAMLVRSFEMSLAEAGWLAGSLLIAGGLAGMVGGGALMDRIGGGTPQARLQFCAIATGLAVVPAAAFALMREPWILAICFFVFFSAAAVTVGAGPSTIQQLAPNRMRATIGAFYVFVVNVIGLAMGPTITALIGDTYFPGGDGIRYAIAIVAAGGYLVATCLFILAIKPASLAWKQVET